MAGKKVTLRGDLDGVVIELSAARKITRVVRNGKLMECETTAFGTFCHVVGAPVPGPGTAPALQLRVTPKSVFAKSVSGGGVGLESAERTGFQRHRV